MGMFGGHLGNEEKVEFFFILSSISQNTRHSILRRKGEDKRRSGGARPHRTVAGKTRRLRLFRGFKLDAGFTRFDFSKTRLVSPCFCPNRRGLVCRYDKDVCLVLKMYQTLEESDMKLNFCFFAFLFELFIDWDCRLWKKGPG